MLYAVTSLPRRIFMTTLRAVLLAAVISTWRAGLSLVTSYS